MTQGHDICHQPLADFSVTLKNFALSISLPATLKWGTTGFSSGITSTLFKSVYHHLDQTNAWLWTDFSLSSTGSKRRYYSPPYQLLVQDKVSNSVKKKESPHNSLLLWKHTYCAFWNSKLSLLFSQTGHHFGCIS